ncbi:6-phosphogluconate dehydrogenase C-terminal domain-like protein [Nemania sp. NC0429]|nr:6-phosphogluconate dehydrogenase C-terminal domain-like protein [Nemania sp. NC0429]
MMRVTPGGFIRIDDPHRRQLLRRLVHASLQMRNSELPRAVPAAEWLRRIQADRSEPPKLYAWTPENLSTRRRRPTSLTRAGPSSAQDNRIYVLGVGNIGRLYAMCLSNIANNTPPITLVVHRRELLEQWAAEPGISLTRHGEVHVNKRFDIEWWTETPPSDGRVVEVAAGRTIPNLIVATKAPDALPQVDRIRRYLGSDSTVAFAQNGICKLWPPHENAYVRARFPEDDSRPNWIACVTTHGVTSQGPFKSTHTAPAGVLVGPVMSGGVDGLGEARMESLMRLIADAPDLNARQVSQKELWVAQLEKLVVNAIINPLTAVLRCENGEIFVARDDALPNVIDKLLSEASETLRALISDSMIDHLLLSTLPGPEGDSEVSQPGPLRATREQLLERFSFSRLRSMVLDVGAKVGANTSSMLQDVRAGKQTEIDDFNGWLVDTAGLFDKGLQLPTHEKLIALVKSEAKLTRPELCAKLLE